MLSFWKNYVFYLNFLILFYFPPDTGYAFSKEDPPEYRSSDTYYKRAQN